MACATLKRPLDIDPLYSPNSRPVKRRRFARNLLVNPSTSIPSCSRDEIPSPFMATSRISSEEMRGRIRHEIRHLRRMKQFNLFGGLEREMSPAGTSSVSGPSTSSNTGVETFGEFMKSGVGLKADCPIFTFPQVALICERMLREKEESIRREYEQALSKQLAEQYDTFVRFTQDTIQKRFEAASAPSYLS